MRLIHYVSTHIEKAPPGRRAHWGPQTLVPENQVPEYGVCCFSPKNVDPPSLPFFLPAYAYLPWAGMDTYSWPSTLQKRPLISTRRLHFFFAHVHQITHTLTHTLTHTHTHERAKTKKRQKLIYKKPQKK